MRELLAIRRMRIPLTELSASVQLSDMGLFCCLPQEVTINNTQYHFPRQEKEGEGFVSQFASVVCTCIEFSCLSYHQSHKYVGTIQSTKYMLSTVGFS